MEWWIVSRWYMGSRLQYNDLFGLNFFGPIFLPKFFWNQHSFVSIFLDINFLDQKNFPNIFFNKTTTTTTTLMGFDTNEIKLMEGFKNIQGWSSFLGMHRQLAVLLGLSLLSLTVWSYSTTRIPDVP